MQLRGHNKRRRQGESEETEETEETDKTPRNITHSVCSYFFLFGGGEVEH